MQLGSVSFLIFSLCVLTFPIGNPWLGSLCWLGVEMICPQRDRRAAWLFGVVETVSLQFSTSCRRKCIEYVEKKTTNFRAEEISLACGILNGMMRSRLFSLFSHVPLMEAVLDGSTKNERKKALRVLQNQVLPVCLSVLSL